MLYTHKTQTYFSLGLQIFQDLDKFLTAQSGIRLLRKHFPQSSSMHNKKRTTIKTLQPNWIFKTQKTWKNKRLLIIET